MSVFESDMIVKCRILSILIATSHSHSYTPPPPPFQPPMLPPLSPPPAFSPPSRFSPPPPPSSYPPIVHCSYEHSRFECEECLENDYAPCSLPQPIFSDSLGVNILCGRCQTLVILPSGEKSSYCMSSQLGFERFDNQCESDVPFPPYQPNPFPPIRPSLPPLYPPRMPPPPSPTPPPPTGIENTELIIIISVFSLVVALCILAAFLSERRSLQEKNDAGT